MNRQRQRTKIMGFSRGASKAKQDEIAVRQIASLFLPAADWVSLQQIGGGMSGAAVYLCQTEAASYALKRWPAGTTATRVDEVHEVMTHSRRALAEIPGLVRSPLGTTRLGWDAHHFELATWMPGEPFAADRAARSAESALSRGPATTYGELVASEEQPPTGATAVRESRPQDEEALLAAVQAGAQAIACFHDSVRLWGSSCAPAPAVLRRLGRIEQLRSELPAALKSLSRCASVSAPLRSAATWLRSEGDRGLSLASEWLGHWASEMVPTQIVLRDVHREHILFSDGQVSGLIDFDAVGRDSVAADLARWVSGFLEAGVDPQAVWQAAEAGYRHVLPLSPCERELAGAISRASGIILLANWVTWIGLRQRDFSACSDLVDRRISDLMRRMVPDTQVAAPKW